MDESTKRLNKIQNQADMLLGCRNRMCVTDDEEELARLYSSITKYSANLFLLNLERIRCGED